MTACTCEPYAEPPTSGWNPRCPIHGRKLHVWLQEPRRDRGEWYAWARYSYVFTDPDAAQRFADEIQVNAPYARVRVVEVGLRPDES